MWRCVASFFCTTAPQESKQALLSAVARALDSYEQGKLDPLHFSGLLEQLQVVLEAVAAGSEGGDGDDADGAAGAPGWAPAGWQEGFNYATSYKKKAQLRYPPVGYGKRDA